MIAASARSQNFNMSDGRGLVKGKFSKLLGGGPRSAIQSQAPPYDFPSPPQSPPQSSGQKTTFFRRVKSISSTSVISDASYSNATHESLVTSPTASETSGASSSRSSKSPVRKPTARPSRSNSASVGAAQSRASSYSTMSRASTKPRPPSPPPVYASFGFEGPVKKTSRPLPLDPKKQKARAAKNEAMGRTVRQVKSKDQCASRFQGDEDPELIIYPVSDTSSRAPTVASFSSDDVSHSSRRGKASLRIATPESPVDSIASRSSDWPTWNGQSGRRARLSRVDDAEDESQTVTISARPISMLPETPMTPFTKELMKVTSEGELRQRNKDKLARTFGEKVPEDLLRRRQCEENEKKGYSDVEETSRRKLDKLTGTFGEVARGDEDDGGIQEVPRESPWPRPTLTISTSPIPIPTRVRTGSSASTATPPSPIVFMPRNIPLRDIPLDSPSSSSTQPSPIVFKPRNLPVTGLSAPTNTPTGPPPALTVSAPEPQGDEPNKEVRDEGQWIARRSNLPSRSSSLLVRPSSATGNYTPSPPATPKPISDADRSPTDPNHNRGASEQIFGSAPRPRPLPTPRALNRSVSVRERPQTAHGALSSPTLPDSSTPFAPYAPGGGQFLSPETATTVTLSGVQRRDRSQGWSGEWNQEDMQDVIRKLRGLK